MQLDQEIQFLTVRFPLMCRADQLTIMALVDSRARAHQASVFSLTGFAALVGETGGVKDSGSPH
jgi:hypothetical protein